MEKRLVYNGGSMTSLPARDFQLKMGEIIKEAGLDVYTPSENKEINSKQELGNKDIAKKIVAKDSEAIINSDIRLFNNGLTVGTSIEIGQVLGMNDFANIIMQLIENREAEGVDTQALIDEIWCLCFSERNKEFILFDVDVRRHNDPESGFKRSTGYHQYQRGVGMKLMDNKDGYLILEEEVIPKLKELGKTSFKHSYQVKFNENDDLVLEDRIDV